MFTMDELVNCYNYANIKHAQTASAMTIYTPHRELNTIHIILKVTFYNYQFGKPA